MQSSFETVIFICDAFKCEPGHLAGCCRHLLDQSWTQLCEKFDSSQSYCVTWGWECSQVDFSTIRISKVRGLLQGLGAHNLPKVNSNAIESWVSMSMKVFAKLPSISKGAVIIVQVSLEFLLIDVKVENNLSAYVQAGRSLSSQCKQRVFHDSTPLQTVCEGGQSLFVILIVRKAGSPHDGFSTVYWDRP